MCSLAEGEEVQELRYVVASIASRWLVSPPCIEDGVGTTYRTLWSCVSSRKLARIAALSFWITARSSAMVFAARTLRMNCFTIGANKGEIVSYTCFQCPRLVLVRHGVRTGTHRDGLGRCPGVLWPRRPVPRGCCTGFLDHRRRRAASWRCSCVDHPEYCRLIDSAGSSRGMDWRRKEGRKGEVLS
jgi:hypothetical protein